MPILTIAIPTYNRAHILAEMLSQLQFSIKGFEGQVEVIISDNCSSDDTPQVVEKWIAQQDSELAIRSIRQKENIGVSRNIVFLLYESTSDYFVFLGDDDQFAPESLPRVLTLLSEIRPVAMIQAICSAHARKSVAGKIDFGQALDWFYEYGNAYAGIVNRKAAVLAIEARSLRNQIENIVWPQTVFGFLAMHDMSLERAILAVNWEIGQPMKVGLNLTTKSYYIKSLTDLLQAAILVGCTTTARDVAARFLKLSVPGFRSHLKAIFWNAIVDNDRTSLKDLRKIFSQNFGWRGNMFALVLKLDDYPRLLRLLLMVAYQFSHFREGQRFGMALERARQARHAEILTKNKSGKRSGEWF